MQKVSFTKIDTDILTVINGLTKKSRWLDFFGIICAKYLGYFLIIVLAGWAYFVSDIESFLVPMVVGFISLIINELIYLFYHRNRPLKIESGRMLIGEPISPAFPSSHASFFLAISLALFWFNLPMAILFSMASLLIAFARVFCGVHWPSDILGGAIVAVVSFLAVYAIFVNF